MNYKETLKFIHSLGNFSKVPTLDRINKVLKLLGNPQDNFSAIHIAGTNGKGSVSAMLHSVFKSAGFKTGLFISPYIIEFRERIQINGEFIPENEFCLLVEKVMATGVELTEFEFITAVAFLYFSKQGCDIVIAETGLGGRLDATNTLKNLNASVITKIGLDHTAVLGNTIEKITHEKCGIIKAAPVITSFNQTDEALEVLLNYNPIIPKKEELKVMKSDITGNEFSYRGTIYKTSLVGNHQIENALVVIETALNCGIDIKPIQNGIENTFFPARMEVISREPLIVLDGAHNPDGAKVLSGMMQRYNGKTTAIIGMCADKDCEEVLKATLPYCKRAIAITIDDVPRSITSEKLCDMANKYCACETARDYDSALEKIKDEECIFAFGSLYLASALRKKLKNFTA